MPVKMINTCIHDIPIMIDRLVHLIRVEVALGLNGLNSANELWYLCKHMCICLF